MFYEFKLNKNLKNKYLYNIFINFIVSTVSYRIYSEYITIFIILYIHINIYILYIFLCQYEKMMIELILIGFYVFPIFFNPSIEYILRVYILFVCHL